MDLTCHSVLSQDGGVGGHSSLGATSRSIEVLPDLDFSPLGTLVSPTRSLGTRVSVDHVLQRLLIQGSLLDDDAVSEAASSDVTSARSVSELSQDGDANELLSSLSGPIAALRAMRRSGPLADIAPEGQMLLLGGTLYEYTTDDGTPVRPLTPALAPLPDTPAHAASGDNTVAVLEASLNTTQPPASVRSGMRGFTGIDASASLAASLVSTPSARSVSLSGIGEDFDATAAPSEVSLQESVYSMGHEQTHRTSARLGDDSLNSTARTVMSGTLVPDRSLGHGATVTSMLRQLVRETAIDESIARSAARVLQLGTVLAGERLSDDEISRLPKARFDQMEEQSCSICLEVYKQGELLNLLPCQHFFHISCLASWFQRSTQCPLCRSSCGGQ